jgi:ribulose-5-phosphate 4-epimerase/fuculose-1-phosphate aldolase
VAQCCRMLEAAGLIDFSGHVSSRSGGSRFLINPRDQSRYTAKPEERGNRLAEALGNARAVVIRGHGSVVAAKNIKAIFFTCVYFERNAQRLLEGYQSGSPQPLPREELEEMKQWLSTGRLHSKIWDYYASRLGKGRSSL